jgi:O-antigen/teichoic acid export membrane protein
MSDFVGNESNFKKSIKGTSLFGGVQIFQILISIIRSKALAIFLGPSGVGILGLFQSTLDMVYSVSNMGLATSAIRDISEANRSQNIERLSRTSSIFKKLVWVTGLLGLCICLFFSDYWSYASFGNHDYKYTFVFLSITVLFRLLAEGQNALLQGTQNLKDMAKANVFGNAIGLTITLPCYYFFGIAGIAPSLFVIYLVNLIVSSYFSHKVQLVKVFISVKDVINEGRIMLKIGFFISLGALLSTTSAYIIRMFVSDKGGLESVGLYTAGFSVVNTYVGLIFTAMSKEYFPRMASISKENTLFNESLNQQMKLSILLLGPFICAFIIFCDFGIRILYTGEFLGIDIMMCLAILAILFKAPSWCCSYAIIAKGDSTAFFIGEFLVFIVMLLANMLLFSLWGLNGLGISFIVIYLYYMFQEWYICKKRFSCKLDKEVIKIYIPYVLCAVLSFLVALYSKGIFRYIVGLIPIVVSLFFSLKTINRFVNLKTIIKRKIK